VVAEEQEDIPGAHVLSFRKTSVSFVQFRLSLLGTGEKFPPLARVLILEAVKRNQRTVYLLIHGALFELSLGTA
jgi:hypothetical protein